MENSKLISITKKLLKFFKTEDDLESIYRKLMNLTYKLNDYLGNFQKEDLVRMVFFLYSLKKTGDFKLAEKILDKIEFISFFITNNENAIESCDNCGGSGNYTCDYCGGDGEVQCNNCDGDGEVDCSECDGTGEIEGNECSNCSGKGKEECSDCGGSGNVECSECDGSGDVECSECDGNGEIQKDTIVYTEYFAITWDPKLIKIVKDMIELEQPFMESDEFFEKYGSKMLILNVNDDDDTFIDDMDEDKIYFFDIDDTPKLYHTGGPNGSIRTSTSNLYIQ